MDKQALLKQLETLQGAMAECNRNMGNATGAATPTPEAILQMHGEIIPELIKANLALLTGLHVVFEYLLEKDD